MQEPSARKACFGETHALAIKDRGQSVGFRVALAGSRRLGARDDVVQSARFGIARDLRHCRKATDANPDLFGNEFPALHHAMMATNLKA